MNKNTISICLMAVLSLLGSTAFAQTKETSSTHTLNPVVITGTGTYHRAEDSPVAVKVITAKELRDAQVSSLQEALTRLTPHVTTHTNGMGTFVNFNGVSDDYIVILENGKRVSGDDRWQRISVSNIKRIEIFSGAASALYGSDAIAGVINVITDDSQAPLSASSTTKWMNKNRLDEDIHVDANLGAFSSHTSYTHHQAGNWQVNNFQEFEEGDATVLKLTGRPMSTAFHSNNLSQKLEWRINSDWSVYLRGAYYDYETDRPQAATYFTQKKSKNKTTGATTYTYTSKQAYTYDLHHQSYTYGGGLRWSPNNRTHVYLDAYSDNFVSKYAYWQTPAEEADEQIRKRTHYVNETLRGIFRLASWNKLSAGTEWVQESLNSQSDNIDYETTNTYNVFAQDEIRINRCLEAVAGVRYTYNNHFGSAITPNAGLFFHLKGFRLRASYAGGYRTPTLSQLYATDQAKTTARYTLSNPDLQPEKNHFFNVNAEYSNTWMSVSVSAFLNKIRNMINYRTLTQAEIDGDASLTTLQAEGWKTLRQRDNIDRATLKGISASVKLLLPAGFTIGGGYALTDSKAETQSLDAETKTYITTESPVDKSVKHTGNILASWDHTWHTYHLNITLSGHFQGRRYSSTYGYADGCTQWDFMTHHTFRLRHYTLEPGLGVENLFNQRDTTPWNSNFSTINPGRSIVASMKMNF